MSEFKSIGNGQLRMLTSGRLGMRLKEFRYYQPPGGYYGNPYDKDFVQEKQKERRHGLIKAGIVGAGLLGGGALLGRGLYKVGKSGAVRRAEDLAEELTNLRATKSAADVGNVAPAPRGRPKVVKPAPTPAPQAQTLPTPPPQTPPPTAPQVTGKSAKQVKAVEDLNEQGALSNADATAEMDEIAASAEAAGKPPRKLTAKQQKLAKRQAKVAKFAAAQSGGAPSVSPAAAVVPKTKAVAAKIETPAAPQPPTKKPQALPSKPAASATNEGLVEIAGVGKFPFTGTPEQTAAFRKRLEETAAAGGFKGKSAGDVVDGIRQSLKPKSDFPEGLSDSLREAGRKNNPQPKGKKKSKAKKQDDDDLDDLDEADDIGNEPGASPEEADWETKLKENPQVRAKKSAAKSDSKKPAAKAATKPAAKSKKGKKEAAPLSFSDRIAAKVKAKRDKKKSKNLSALLQRVRYFNQFQADEAGVPLTGRVARDRFVKKIRDEDLDRRDANILRAGGAGALAGLLARGRIGASKRALIGAGAGGLGVLGIRALTKNDRDIYGERDRGSKRAELLPAVGGLGAAAWLAGKRLKAFAAKFNRKQFNHGGHGEHGGVKEFGIASRIEYLTGQTHFRGAEEILERGKNYRRGRDWARGRGDDSLAAEKAGRAKEFIKTARLFRNEGSRRRNISIGVGAGAALGAGVGGAYLATRPKKSLAARLRGVKEFNDPHRPDWALHPSGGSLHVQSLVYKPQNYVPRWGMRRLLASKSDKVRSDAFDQAMRERERRRGLREASMQKESNLSARLRSLKNFDDYRLYYFKGRNTGIAAKSVEEARSKKKRGGDELVAVRTPSDSERGQMARGVWVRTRRDGKSPGQSRYGKGRGQGPARKSLSAKLRGLKEFGSMGLQKLYRKNAAIVRDGLQAATQDGKRAAVSRLLKEDSRLNWKRGATKDRWLKLGVREKARYNPESLKLGNDGMFFSTPALRAIKFFEKREKRGLNPYVGAALSGFGSGAALGSLALLRRGATFRGAAKTAGKLGLASAGIVGGGALLGSKIVGDPRKEESAPFMKRAAIGGTLVGAGAGLGGALLLRRTSGGARALVAASKKSEPFSRPAMWLRKAPLAGAAGIGAAGGALYGGGMGLDEGQQVDSIRNLRKDMKNFSTGSKLREFSAKLRFFGRGDQARWDARKGGGVGVNEDSQFANVGWGWATDRPMYIPKRNSQGRVEKDPDTGDTIRMKWDPNSGQLWNSIAREAKNKRVTVQRGGRLTRDAAAVIQGKERERDASGRIKKREWEKSWFQNKATEIGMTAAGLGGLATVRYANNNPDTKVGKAWTNTQKSVRATGDGLSEIGGSILKGITRITAKKAFSAKLKKLRELDAIAEYEGWDVRDPRGRSARVFAPGSRKRDRRPKEWHEKTENERKLWKAGIAAGVLGGVGVTLVGQRLVSGKSLIPSRFLKKKPIDPSKFADTPPSAKEAEEILKNWKTP
jgi:hypothetical protein